MRLAAGLRKKSNIDDRAYYEVDYVLYWQSSSAPKKTGRAFHNYFVRTLGEHRARIGRIQRIELDKQGTMVRPGTLSDTPGHTARASK